MLLIHFTGDDLARTRLAARPDPMWEIVLSAYLLRGEDSHLPFDTWRSTVRRSIDAATRPLLSLIAPTGSVPDFLTPAGAASLDEGIDALLTTPRATLAHDLANVAKERPLPPWTLDLGAGKVSALTELATAGRRYFDSAIAPYWANVDAEVGRDRAVRSRIMATQGAEGLLDSLRPYATWTPPVLRIPVRYHHEIHLQGRGITLIPCFFAVDQAMTLVDPALPPVLTFPIHHELGWLQRKTGQDPLARLLGETRATVLRAIADGACSTTELARRTGTYPPTASKQATILREAGLISSTRHGPAILHAVTPLGSAVVTGAH